MTHLCSVQHDDPDAYALATARDAANDPNTHQWAIGGTAPDETHTEREYGVEPDRGAGPYEIDTELAGPIESLPYYVNPRLITREVTYGPWRYVTPEEITEATNA